jgi:hypothetical protein
MKQRTFYPTYIWKEIYAQVTVLLMSASPLMKRQMDFCETSYNNHVAAVRTSEMYLTPAPLKSET